MIFKTKFSFFKLTLATIDFVILFFCGFFLIYMSSCQSIGMWIFGLLLILFGIFKFVFYAQILCLKEDQIIIEYPFTLNLKSNEIIKLEEIKEMIFKGSYGRVGPRILISFKKNYEEKSVPINFLESEIDNLIFELNNLGIRTQRENI